MERSQLFRSVLAFVLIFATLLSLGTVAFAEQGDREQIQIDVNDLIARMDAEEEASEELVDDYEPQIVCPELDELLGEQEDREFGYLDDEDRANLLGETDPETKDVRGPDYVFLDFKVGSASRNFNWQVKTDSSSNQYFAANKQGLIAGYFQGDDPRLYMPVETKGSGLERLKSYALKSGDIVQIRIYETTANKFFTDGGTGTYNSYLTIRTSNDVDAWASCGSKTIKRQTAGQTIQWSTPAAQVGKTLYGVRWDPIQPTDAQKGTFTEHTRIYVDYIYVGPANTAPVSVRYKKADGSTFSQGFGYVGYGKKAVDWDHEQADSETSTQQTIWGWQVWQQINGTWTDMKKFITDPSTFTCKYNTEFRLTKVTIKKDDLSGELTQVYDNGVSADDDKYKLTVNAVDLAKMNLSRYGKPLDVSLVVDRSSSMADLTSTKKLSKKADMTTYLDSLDKTKFPGYYRASCWRRNNNKGGSGGKAYVYHMPMRYYRGEWQMQVLKKSCNCNGTVHRDYGIYPWNSTGLKPCSHVGWVSMSAGWDLYEELCKAQGYTVSGVPFEIGPCRLGKMQHAVEGFLQKLYNSTSNLKKGQYHTVSLLGFGQSVFISNYPYYDEDSKYKTSNNASCNKVSTQMNHSNYESILSVLRGTHVYGATRTDCALQVLSGEVSALEKSAGKSAATQTKTNYIPAASSARRRVVILLTDGCPTSNLDFNNTVATDAIDASRRLKANQYTTVYTIGIMAGLDSTKYYTSSYSTGTEAQKANNFLNLVSSRYKEATDYNSAGAKTTGDFFFSDTSAGSSIATQMTTIWDSNAPSISTAGYTGVASLWLYEEFGREWKPDPEAPIKIYAAPYLGADKFGDKVLIGQHQVSNTNAQIITGAGYKVHIAPFDDQRFSVTLQWTDAKQSFLRETALSTNSAAKAIDGSTLDLSKGYKVYMEIPLEVDRNNTMGGNNIPLTKNTSGCYAADSSADSAKGSKLSNYEVPNANVFCTVGAECYDYFISLEDYISLHSGTSTNKLKSVLDNMVRIPDTLKPSNDKGLSNLDYVSFDVQLKAPNNTVLLHKAAALHATSMATNVSNVQDTLANLKTDQMFTLVAKLTNATSNTDSFGRAPYPNVNTTLYPTYYVPKFAVVDFDGTISVDMGMEGDSTKLSSITNGTFNSTSKKMVYNFNNKMINADTAEIGYKFTTQNAPKGTNSKVVNREVTIIPANVVTYDNTFLNFLGAATLSTQTVNYTGKDGTQKTRTDTTKRVAWKGSGTYATIEQSFNNGEVHGYDAKYVTNGDLHGAIMYATVKADAITYDKDDDPVTKVMENTAQAEFTFRGTGFEVLSRTAPDSGVMIAEIFSGDTLKASILCDTYLSTGTYRQVPVIRWEGTHGTYKVKLTAYYHPMFALKSALTEEHLRELLGYDRSVDFTYIPSETRVINAETRALRGSYNVYVDGIRVFNPAVAGTVTNFAHGQANEGYATFSDLRDMIIDATNWNGGVSGIGMLYMADLNKTTDINGVEQSNLTGHPLGMEDTVSIQKVGDRIYYLDENGKRYKDPKHGKEIFFTFYNDRPRYCIDNPKPTEDQPYLFLSQAYVREILGSHFYYYNKAYRTHGPKTEVYLKQNCGVGFNATGTKVHLSLKSENGTACRVQVWNAGTKKWEDYKDPAGQTTLSNLTCTTEMFYDFSHYKGTVVLRNAGAGILSIVHVKTIGASMGITVDESVMLQACEAFDQEAPVEVLDHLKLSHSLNLQSNIGINYIVPKAALADFDAYYLHCTVGGQLINPEPVEKGDYIYFTLDCLSAAQMNENVRAVLRAYKEEEVYTSPADDYSIALYAYTMLNKDGIHDSVKTLCANLLRYGAATQLYKDYQTDALADEELSVVHQQYLTDLDTVSFESNFSVLDDLEAATVTWAGKTLSLDSTVAVKLLVDASDFEADAQELSLRVSYLGADGQTKTEILDNPVVYNADAQTYLFTIDCLDAAELRTVLTAAVYHGDTQVSSSMQYSADSYGVGKEGDLLRLCKALFAYVDAAKEFFAN
ncbi:MAG: VWA domain-containing protein [Oscillospiraceae bacterium]|nr:VWA domain-containing protein [Oscillospiraceae bacterium]